MPDPAELFAAAQAARANAYAPYSNFMVGAVVETVDGRRYAGANVENASYGLTICAERVAVFRAVADGARALAAVAVAGPDGAGASPCGACRQVLAEFGSPAMRVVYAWAGELVEATLGALLPAPFDLAVRGPH